MTLHGSDVYTLTIQYYSRFCCTDLSKLEHGVHFVCSAERDSSLKGYGCKYSLYILQKEDLCIVAYSPALRCFVDTLPQSPPDRIIAAAQDRYRLKTMRLLLFQQENVLQYGDAKVLGTDDYPFFESFFRETHKSAETDGWLSDYFLVKAEKGYFTGYFRDGRLVSVCDAPDMPYLEDRIQHTGIVTLEEERRKGYGKRTAALATHGLLQKGIVNDIRNCLYGLAKACVNGFCRKMESAISMAFTIIARSGSAILGISPLWSWQSRLGTESLARHISWRSDIWPGRQTQTMGCPSWAGTCWPLSSETNHIE